jgi:hypothetical protein
MAPGLDKTILRKISKLFDISGITRKNIVWASHEEDGITVLRVQGMRAASERGTQRDAAPLFVAHGTTVQGLHGILTAGQVVGSETLNNLGFWGVGVPWVSPDTKDMGEMLRVVKKVSKSGLNSCNVVVGLCGHMSWVPMTQGGHDEENEVVTAGKACHMKKSADAGTWHRWSIPVNFATITHLFLLDNALDCADAYLDLL